LFPDSILSPSLSSAAANQENKFFKKEENKKKKKTQKKNMNYFITPALLCMGQ